MEKERRMKSTEVQCNHYMNNGGQSSFFTANSIIVNSNKACISSELASLIYNEVENKEVLRSMTIKQVLCEMEKNAQQIENMRNRKRTFMKHC